MKLELKHIGSFGSRPAKIVEIKIGDGNVTLTESITDLKGMVSEELIQNLKDVVDDLEEHNQQTANQTEFK